MKTTEELQQLYESKLMPALQAIENTRKGLLAKYISGVIEKTDFQFSEIHTQYKTTKTDNEGKTETDWHTVFKGLFVHADFNKEIKGRTFILPEHASKQFNKHGMSINDGGKTELVKLENVEFEKISMKPKKQKR